jgi:hypothetical protein
VAPASLYNPDYNNFAPHFGFAYDVTGKASTVIRGGWGIFYDAFSQDIFLGHVPFNCSFCPGPTLWLAKTSYTRKMNDMATGSIRTVPIKCLS